jgi:hypothetical protein
MLGGAFAPIADLPTGALKWGRSIVLEPSALTTK